MDIIIFWMHNSSPHICKGQSKLKWREDVRHISTSDIQLTCRPLPIARTELFNTKVNFSHDGHKLGLEHITLHAIHRGIVATFCFLYNYTQKDSSETFPISTAFRLQCPPSSSPIGLNSSNLLLPFGSFQGSVQSFTMCTTKTWIWPDSPDSDEKHMLRWPIAGDGEKVIHPQAL